MSATFTLTYDGATRTLAGWGIARARLVKRSMDADELLFTIPTEDALEDPTFPAGSAISVQRDGTPIFIGTIRQEQAALVGGKGDEQTYIAANGWWQLDRIVYQQDRCVDEVVGGNFSGTLVKIKTPQVVLGQTPLGGRYTVTTAAMVPVIQYAFGVGSGLTTGAISGGEPFPLEEVRNLTCGEIIRRLAAYTPDMVSWVTYDTGAQVLNIQRRSALSTVTYDCDAAAGEITEINLTPRTDLVPPGVRLHFVTSEADPADNNRTKTTLTTQTAGNPDLPGGIIATIHLAGEGTSKAETPPTAAALQMFTAMQSTQYEGTIVTGGEDTIGDIDCGKKLNLSNGRTAWASMAALVQSVTEYLDTGRTEIRVGAPERFGAEDFIDQLMFARRPRFFSNIQAVMTCRKNGPDIDDDGEVPDTGDEEDDNEDAGISPEAYTDEQRLPSSVGNAVGNGFGQTVTLTQCEGGAEVDYTVMGTQASL